MSSKTLFVLVFGVYLSRAACDTNVTSTPVESVPVTQSSIVFEGPTDKIFRKDYTYEAETETYYKEHTVPRNWHQAIAMCKAEGAQLAIPFTELEAYMIKKHFSGRTYLTWIAVHDLFAEGKFMTVTGTRIADIYANWVEGEPNNFDGDENCLGMTKEGKYNDVPCVSFVTTFVCTKRQSEVVRNNKCETSIEGYFFETEAERCYKIHTTPMNWHDAYGICDNEEASLAMANSEAEANLFIKFMARYPETSLRGNFDTTKFMFVDFTDLVTQGEFVTSKGQNLEEAGWSAWSEGQPDNHEGEEHCGSIRRDGKLNDLRCDFKAFFVCEKALRAYSPGTAKSRYV